jgi:hypothetical protein
MLSLRFWSPVLCAAGAARKGTIALYFSSAGTCTFVPENGAAVTLTAVAGTQIETGPIESFTTLPANTIGFLGR